MPRWKMTIKTDAEEEVWEEDEIADFQAIVEVGPAWTDPGYMITIEYQRGDDE